MADTKAALEDEELRSLGEKIDELYFHKNFGTVSKTDFETLLFSEYIEHRIKNGLPFDDYTLSKALGLTQTRIRSLKERKELKYPHNDTEDWWKEPLLEAIKNAKYVEKEHLIKFIIQDVNVMNEVRHYVEINGWYDECSLNRKLFSIPLDCFVEVFVSDDKTKEQDLFSAEIRKRAEKILSNITGEEQKKAVKEFLADFSKSGLKKVLMSASKEVTCMLLNTLPFGGLAEKSFRVLCSVIEKA